MKQVKRLFDQFQPKHYDLNLTVNSEAMTFSGTVTISGQKVGRPAERLTLHQKALKITNAHVTRHDKRGDQIIEIDRINSHKSYDEVRLHSKKKLFPGAYSLRLDFNGVITKQMNGMYPCYFEDGKKTKKLIATQFESHHAREVFPCIDEPEAKATFQLTLTHPAGETALSNTPISNQEKVTAQAEAPQLKTTFETTPSMSTYLLAFVFGEIDYLEAKTRQGTIVRTYATKSNVAFTDFALDTAVRCLEFYNDYFQIDYPLPKCDFIALPDFASGAMENWGLITFREQTLLVDPKNSTLSNKQYVALVVAHELAHQWFGNLVTMRWWTDLWLNEGFASWIEYLATDHLFPDWEVWTQFAVDEQQQALKLDALEHTHPIEVPVKHPDEIRTIFDAISYSKGASVIHMLHQYLSSDVFRDGLRHYLKTHQYSNTDTIDLWSSLETVSKKPIKDFMQHWTGQSGFPLVHVRVKPKSLELEQERFFTSPAHDKQPAELWPVPLLADTTTLPEIFDTKNSNHEASGFEELKLNRGQSGFYRVAYNDAQLEKLGKLIKSGDLPPLDRLGILSDLFETAKAGYIDTDDALRFLQNFGDENNYAVWDTIASAIAGLRLVMGDEQVREAMKPFIRQLVAAQLARLGWNRQPKESHFDRLLRPLILGLAASADEPAVVKRCQQLFAEVKHPEDLGADLRSVASTQQVKRGIDIDPDLRGAVFGTVARLGGTAEFEKLLLLHNSSKLSEERVTLTAAMTGFRQPALVKRALALIDSDDVRLQDVAYWIAYSFLNRHAKTDTWQWLQKKWDWLEDNLGSDLSFYRMPIYVARVFSDKSFLKEYEDFFKPRLSPGFERSYRQGKEMLEWQTAWKTRDYKKVKTFFSQFQ